MNFYLLPRLIQHVANSRLEIYGRVIRENNVEIIVRGDGTFVWAHMFSDILIDYIRDINVIPFNSLEVRTFRVELDADIVQDQLYREFNILPLIRIDPEYRNGFL